jgi:hypothetical protein
MVTVPVREVVAVFWATEMETVPLPDPLAPLVTVIHAALETAVQEQPLVEVTFTLALPPLLPTEVEVALSE